MKKLLLFFCVLFPAYSLISQNVYQDYKDGQLYVKLNKTLLKEIEKENPLDIPFNKFFSLNNLFVKYGATKISRPFYQATGDEHLTTVIKLHFTQKSQVGNLIEDLEKQKGIEYAEKVPLMKTDVLPNDPVFPAQLTQINAPNAWNVFNGTSNITVAIVDNAVMWTHSDLVANAYINTAEIASNSIDDDGNGYIDDVNGYDVADWDNNAIPTNTAMDHGTHCAGIAGARTDNSIGIASIGWNIKIIPVKCAYNTSSINVVDAGYEGIIYAVKARARVISCSWGGFGGSATEQAVVQYAWNNGSIIVASAGNLSSSIPSYPGAYNFVYCVSSVNGSDGGSGFTNFGTWVDIAAPGEGIYSTVPSATTGTYNIKSGTSMATPLVAGLAGLMLSKCSWMSSTDVLNCISSTAVNIYTLAANSTYTAGNLLGAGRIDAFAAMNCAAAFLSVAPVANFFAYPLNSCPLTPVQFYDSSLYAPTNYTWTFQSGTPASSNLVNPLVQWSAPGTYSVALTVSNANGSNAKTKLTYITIAGPQPLPFFEGFQNAPFLPPNWTPKNYNSDAAYWERYTGVGGFGTSTACAKFDNYNYVTYGFRDEMRSPKFSFNNVAVAKIRFDVAYARYNATFSDTLEVKISTNCGTSWNQIYIKGGTTLSTQSDMAGQFIPTSGQWRTDSVDISPLAAGQNNVMFTFLNHGQYGQAIYLDNINLFFPTPTLNINPVASVCVNNTISLVNTSSASASYTWNFPGGIPATSTQSNPSVSYATTGIYTLTMQGVNGTSTASITRTISVLPYPVITANTPTICSGAVAIFSFTGASNYTLSPGGSTGSIISVSPPTPFLYTVTGSNGACSSTANAIVIVNPNPTVVVNSASICPGQNAVLSASGASTYSWSTGANISSIVVSPATSTNYVVTGYSSFNCSNTQTSNVMVYPDFTVTANTNSTTVCSAVICTLTATGASTYIWSAGPSGSSITVNPFSTTTYSAIGTVGSCTNMGVVTVSVIPTPTVSLSASPSNSICAGNSATLNANGSAYSSFIWPQLPATGSSVVVSPVTPITTYTLNASGNVYGCETQSLITVFVQSLPSTALSVTQAACSLFCNGVINGTTIAGQAPYTYSLSAGSCSMLPCTGLCAGLYQLTVTDAFGCVSTQTASISNLSGTLTTAVSFTNASCSSCSDGAAQVNATGGISPYTFTWIPSGGNSNTASSLLPGCYTVNISDANACPSKTVACISFEMGIQNTASIFQSLQIFPNPADEVLHIEFYGNNFNLYLFNQLGQLIMNKNEIQDQALLQLSEFAKGIYFIEVRSGDQIARKKLVLQ